MADYITIERKVTTSVYKVSAADRDDAEKTYLQETDKKNWGKFGSDYTVLAYEIVEEKEKE